MDWFVDLLKDYGGTAIGVVVAVIIVVIFFSIMDRHPVNPPSDARKKDAPRDDH